MFEVVIREARLKAIDETLVMQRGLLKIAKLLADSGVDCGVGSSLFYNLYALRLNQSELNLSLFRIIMTHSQTDPFEEAGNLIVEVEVFGHTFSILTKQEE